MWRRSGDYLAGVKLAKHRDVFSPTAKREDIPRPPPFSVGVVAQSWLSLTNSCFAAFGAIK